ncbi:MAG: sugar nucleotide-binding protein [Verrucomicrobia bacterium]|nr:sugar nucleotide-binding protein [Verrucomicrobiota bacterium]
MIVLLGATGYIGQAFETALKQRGEQFLSLSRQQLDYTQFDLFLDFLRKNKPSFIINAAGYTGKPNVDACENFKADTLQGNTLFPQTVAQACSALDVPWGHVSSGCIYSGAKISDFSMTRVERDLTRVDLKALRKNNALFGFTEEDEPNFSFRQPPCSFYSGTKALGEEAILNVGRSYIWRLRIPFDHLDNARNYLSKVQRYAKVYDNVNSLSHRADFVNACLDTWKVKAPFGIYNVTNPGYVTTRQVVQMIQDVLKPARGFEFWESDEEFYKVAAKTPRSNCIMDTNKLISAGVKLRSVEEALAESLQHWKAE